MKIFWLTVVSLAALGIQPVLAYEARLPGQKDPGKNRAAQRGGEINQSRLTDPKNPLSRAQSTSTQPKPWEAKPWEQAQEDLRRDELKRGEAQKMEEKRRVGRKARRSALQGSKKIATLPVTRTAPNNARPDGSATSCKATGMPPLTGTHPLCDKVWGTPDQTRWLITQPAVKRSDS